MQDRTAAIIIFTLLATAAVAHFYGDEIIAIITAFTAVKIL